MQQRSHPMGGILALVPQEALSSTERFVFLPLFSLVSLYFVFLGVAAIRERRVGARLIDRILHGRREYTGRTAVLIGVGYCVGGGLLILLCVVMLVLGRTLLPK